MKAVLKNINTKEKRVLEILNIEEMQTKNYLITFKDGNFQIKGIFENLDNTVSFSKKVFIGKKEVEDIFSEIILY